MVLGQITLLNVPHQKHSGPQSNSTGNLRLAYYLYRKGLQKLLEPEQSSIVNSTLVNSEIIGATVNEPGRRIYFPPTSPVKIRLNHLHKRNVANPRCVFWNVNTSSWDTWGCVMIATNMEFTDCQCTHLTSFAVLMDVTGTLQEFGSIRDHLLTWFTRAGCGISSTCLLLSITVFTVFPALWNDRTTIHRNLCICLLAAEVLFLFGIEYTQNKIGCTMIAAFMHYSFLSAFCWMLLEGKHAYFEHSQIMTKTQII